MVVGGFPHLAVLPQEEVEASEGPETGEERAVGHAAAAGSLGWPPSGAGPGEDYQPLGVLATAEQGPG